MRWTKKDTDLLKKKVKNYNAKINRLEKSGYYSDLIPARKSYKQLKAEYINADRKDFKKEIQMINEFTKRGSEKVALKSTRGAYIPAFEKKQIDMRIKAINKKIAAERERYENLEATDRNKKLGIKVKDKKNLAFENLRPLVFKWENMSKKEYEVFKEVLKGYEINNTEKDKLYRENYYKAALNVFGEERFLKLKKILDKIPTEKLMEKYYTDINMDLDFIYEPTEQDIKYEAIIESWNSVLEGE